MCDTELLVNEQVKDSTYAIHINVALSHLKGWWHSNPVWENPDAQSEGTEIHRHLINEMHNSYKLTQWHI